VLLSDTSSSDDEDDDIEMSLTDAEVREMLRQHVRHKRYQKQFAADKEVELRLTLWSFLTHCCLRLCLCSW